MKKRIFSLILALTLILGCIPFVEMGAYAATPQEVRVRVEGKDKTLYDRKVTVTDDVYCNEYLNMIDNKANIKGFINTLLGETPDYEKNKDSWMNYYVKDDVIDTSKPVNEYKLNDADGIVVYVANFNVNDGDGTLIPVVDLEKDGNTVEMAVYGKSWKVTTPYDGAELKISYVGNKKTDKDGKYSFNMKGIQKIQVGDYPELVRKTIYVGEEEVLQKVKSTIEDLKDYYNKQDTLDHWVAPAYFMVSETDNEFKQINYKYIFPEVITEKSSAVKYAGNIIGLLSAGKNPKDIKIQCGDSEKDIITILKESQRKEDGKFIIDQYDNWTSTQAFAILALDLVDENYDKEKAVKALLSYQNKDGDFSGSVDMTAMTLFALANHRDVEGVESAIQCALENIKDQQLNTGGFLNFGGKDSPETNAMVIKALVALDINPLADEWKKDGNSVLDALLAFKQGGQFKSADGQVSATSTKQAFSALADLYKAESMYHSQSLKDHYKFSSFDETDKYEFTLTRDGSSNFEKGQEAQLNIDVKNNSKNNKTVTFAVTLYKLNGYNKELYTYTFMKKEINAGDTEEVAGGFLIPSEGDYQIKGILWDDFENKNPIAEPITVEVQ
ncbi:prenyltransferase/squalene oxidase repeat-containing protein [Marinisporobacter balticus]|uniref:Surface/cell-adhesion protein n=1 Tax=Marinisporobacter balticus TaxID=2018667 RepID=A0A4R2KD22_9FIRM|nr:prenyltransferase/squalene oxidase repeat-containing protein [Marinisporobacter balticus]TCO71481.1 hypothetical protein EV214_12133 [Marinisporobacter balticus]